MSAKKKSTRSRRFTREPTIAKSIIPRSAGTSRAACGISARRLTSTIFVPGEGWVEWTEIAIEVTAASRVFWLRRKLGRLVRAAAHADEIVIAATALRSELTRLLAMAAATKDSTTPAPSAGPEHKTSLAA